MSFNLQWLQRANATLDLNKVSNPQEGQASGFGPTMWLYNGQSTGSNDSSATIQTSGYFDGATGYLSQNDLIYVACNDSSNTVAHLLNVTSTTGNTTVTTAQLA